jgi:transcriptional regulator with XRE-family HTH domain
VIRPDIEPVYLPHNEPYLGQPHLLAFDEAIPDAMRTNLEVTQQMIASYEVGRRRVPVSLLPALAHALAVSVEVLIGQKEAAAPGKRGPARKLQQQMERIQRLPKAKQRFVMEMIDTVLAQQDR